MTDVRRVRCHWEAQQTLRGIRFKANGEKLSFAVAEVSFQGDGPEVGFWLVRDGRTRLLAIRKNGIANLTGFGMNMMESNGSAGVRLSVEQVRPGDGFVVMEGQRACEAGEPEIDDEGEHPTIKLGPGDTRVGLAFARQKAEPILPNAVVPPDYDYSSGA